VIGHKPHLNCAGALRVGRDAEFSRVRPVRFKPNSEMLGEQRHLSVHPIGEFRQDFGVRPIRWIVIGCHNVVDHGLAVTIKSTARSSVVKTGSCLISGFNFHFLKRQSIFISRFFTARCIKIISNPHWVKISSGKQFRFRSTFQVSACEKLTATLLTDEQSIQYTLSLS
jgi:hypothetical protein